MLVIISIWWKDHGTHHLQWILSMPHLDLMEESPLNLPGRREVRLLKWFTTAETSQWFFLLCLQSCIVALMVHRCLICPNIPTVQRLIGEGFRICHFNSAISHWILRSRLCLDWTVKLICGAFSPLDTCKRGCEIYSAIPIMARIL